MKYSPQKIQSENQPSPFSAYNSNLQVMWDSTSLAWLKKCPRYYELRMLEGLETKRGSIHLTFGIIYHEALETYDKLRAHGEEHHSAQRAAARKALEDSVIYYDAKICQNCGQQWNAEEERTQCPGCGDDPPEETSTLWVDNLRDFKEKGREQLVRTIIWYTDQFRQNPLNALTLSNGEPAVELSFTIPLDSVNKYNEQHHLRGHIDMIARHDDGGLFVLDRKSTKSTLYDSYFDGFSPGNQVTLYTLSGKLILGEQIQGLIIDAAQVAVNFSRFQRGYINRTQSQLDEWLQDFDLWMQLAELYAERGHWPQQEEACNLYGGCPFRAICGRSPEVRQSIIENDYVRRPWNPAINR